MIGVVVAAHGELAQALVATARQVVPAAGVVHAVGVEAADDTARYEARLRLAVQGVQAEGAGVLILTDMFGGTPANVSLTLHEPDAIEVLTGANLPMLIKALQLSPLSLELAEVARRVRDSGSRAISIASEILARPTASERPS